MTLKHGANLREFKKKESTIYHLIIGLAENKWGKIISQFLCVSPSSTNDAWTNFKSGRKTTTEIFLKRKIRLPTKSILENVKQFFSCRTKSRNLSQQLSSFDVEPTYRGSNPMNQNELFW